MLGFDSIDIFIQVLVNGILFGTMYGIAALGLSLIFGTMQIIFIAQGVMIVLGAYGTFWLFKLMGLDPYVSIIIVVPCAMLFGAGVYQLLFRKVAGRGESGKAASLLLAFGMTFPNRMIMLLFPPIPMKAKYMVVLFGILELYLGLSGSAPGIANFAHLGGMLFGYLLLRRWATVRRR